MLWRNKNTSEDSLLKKTKIENSESETQLIIQSLIFVAGATEQLINCLKYFSVLLFSNVIYGTAISTLRNLQKSSNTCLHENNRTHLEKESTP